QAGPSAETSSQSRKRTAYTCGGIDPLPLRSWLDLCKRSSCCFGERKYFSSTSVIKISDNVHAAAGLGDAKIFAVEHLPFHAIPQSVQRIEDRRKRPSAVMRQQAGYVLKQQIARVPGFSQAGKFKEEGAAGVSESLAASSKAESLARKSSAEQFKVEHVFWIGFSGISGVPLSFAPEQGAVTALGVFVALAVYHANKTAGTGQPLAEAADAGEHVNKTNGLSTSLPNKKACIACHLCGKHCRHVNLWFGLVTALPHGSGCRPAQAAAGQAARHSVPAAASRRRRGRSRSEEHTSEL